MAKWCGVAPASKQHGNGDNGRCMVVSAANQNGRADIGRDKKVVVIVKSSIILKA